MDHQTRFTSRDDHGSAMVIALLVMAVLTGLGTVVFTIGRSNLQNVGRDRLAGGAQGASEAGVAQALTFMRSNGVGTLNCRQVPANSGTWVDCGTLWGRDNPKTVTITLSGGSERIYKTWMERVQPFAPSQGFKIGTYTIHSEGTTIPRPGKRTVNLTVQVKPLEFPIGLFGNTFSDPGSAKVQHESMFSTGCIGKRNLITFSGIDPYHNIPAAAHSIKYITESLGSCSATDQKNIHQPPPPVTDPGPCNVNYPADQDLQGGSLALTPCATTQGLPPGYSSRLGPSAEDLQQYGYDTSKPKGLSDAEYKALKAKAQEQGYYSTSRTYCTGSNVPPACWKTPDPTQHPNAVMYFDLVSQTGSKTVTMNTEFDVGGADIYGESFCGQRSLIIIVRDGDLDLQGNINIVGAVFVPDADPVGVFHGAGSTKVLGTLFANKINLNGGASFTLKGPAGKEDCFFQNFPGGLIDVTPTRFRELDR